MNIGNAITLAMMEQRFKDARRFAWRRNLSRDEFLHRLVALDAAARDGLRYVIERGL